MEELYKLYPGVFGERDEKDSEEGKESDNEDKDSESDDSNEANTNSWVWYELIDLVSDLQKIPWREVSELSVIEFCNTVSYAIYKNKKKEEQINRYKQTH